MKRSSINTLLLLLIFLVLVFGVVFLSNPDLFVKKDDKQSGTIPNSQRVSMSVCSGRIDYTYTVPGKVESNHYENYRKTISLDNAKVGDSSVSVNKGAVFSQGDKIAEIGRKPIQAPFNGRLIGYRVDETNEVLTLELLDYDALCIRTTVEEAKIEQISYDTPVRIIYGSKKIESKIEYISYIIEDGRVEILVSIPESQHLLPGQELKLEFVVGSKEMGMYLRSYAVLFDFDGSAYCLAYNEEGTLQKRPLVVGDTFTVESDGYLFEYIEIISGVEPDEILTIESVGDIQPSIEGLIDE